MAIRSSNTPSPPSASLPVIFATVAILIILIGGLAWHYFGSHTAGAPAHALTADEIWLQQKAKESGGDYNKLSQDDQRRLFAIKGPQAPFLLKEAAHPVHVGQ